MDDDDNYNITNRTNAYRNPPGTSQDLFKRQNSQPKINYSKKKPINIPDSKLHNKDQRREFKRQISDDY